MHFERYVTPKLKEVLQNNNISFRSRLTAAAEFLATLGVRCPSERSIQTTFGAILILGMGYE